jgi:hypothetical protein
VTVSLQQPVPYRGATGRAGVLFVSERIGTCPIFHLAPYGMYGCSTCLFFWRGLLGYMPQWLLETSFGYLPQWLLILGTCPSETSFGYLPQWLFILGTCPRETSLKLGVLNFNFPPCSSGPIAPALKSPFHSGLCEAGTQINQPPGFRPIGGLYTTGPSTCQPTLLFGNQRIISIPRS